VKKATNVKAIDITSMDHKLSDLNDTNNITTDNLIDFTDLSDSTSESSSDNYNEKVSAAPLSYIIKICGVEYKIDFDQFKQINVTNSNKKRAIKRITIDGHIENIENYLKTNHNVLGIAGVKF